MTLWTSLLDKPVFVLTSDQDWTPGWAAQQFLELEGMASIQPHFFRTNPCPILDNAATAGLITQGWHPNFLPGSSHGDDVASVVGYMKSTFPGLTTARSHAFYESTYAWDALRKAGVVADSQGATLFQPELQPLLLSNGMIRFPIFFEDDVFFEKSDDSLVLEPVLRALFTPGLKILNFHSTFVAANIPSREYYNSVKARIFAARDSAQPSDIQWSGRGTRQIFEELVQCILDAGFEIMPFPRLVSSTLAFIANNTDRFACWTDSVYVTGQTLS